MMPFYYIPLLLILLFASGWLFRKPLASSGGKIFARIFVSLFAVAGAVAWTLLFLALRQAAQQGLGQIVNTYVAAQAAIDSHTYDPTTPERSYSFSTPDCYGQYYTYGATNYFNGVTAAETFVNFYNTNDWTLASNVWQKDENEKPDAGYGYDVYSDGQFSESDYGINVDIYFPQNTYTILAYCDQAHAYSLGAQPDVGGVFSTNKQISLPTIWPPDPSGNDYRDHFWHSAEFRSDYPQRWLFWNTVLTQMRLNRSQ